MTSVSGLLNPVVSRAARSGILVDFDGTLSPIVADPEEARPLRGMVDALERLVRRYQVVGVLSGRPLAFLEPLMPEEVVVAGLYGLEVLDHGVRTDHPNAGAWREAVEDVARCSIGLGPQGMRVESKGLSLTLHYRSSPELSDQVAAWATTQGARSGLVVRPARMSVELHPPIDADKGTALESVASELEAVCYVGDDVGDLPAFDALDRLASKGVHALRVAVASDESPPVLLDRADLVVDGPEGVLAFLRDL